MQARGGQVELLVKKAERDERRKQELVLVMNSSYNEVVKRLVSALMNN